MLFLHVKTVSSSCYDTQRKRVKAKLPSVKVRTCQQLMIFCQSLQKGKHRYKAPVIHEQGTPRKKSSDDLFVIFVNDNTCLMSELPFSLGPPYLFVCKEIKIDKQVSSKTKVESCVIVKSHLVRRETCI